MQGDPAEDDESLNELDVEFLNNRLLQLHEEHREMKLIVASKRKNLKAMLSALKENEAILSRLEDKVWNIAFMLGKTDIASYVGLDKQNTVCLHTVVQD